MSGRPVWVGVLLALVLVAGLAYWLTMTADEPSAPGESHASAPIGRPVDAGTRAGFAPYTIDIPRVAEVAFGQRIYTLVSGNIVSRGEQNELRLRLRLMNLEPVDANFWNATFRLSVDGGAIAPSGDLNEVVPGRSLRYGIVTFPLPPSARAGTLQFVERNRQAEVPLNLEPTGRPPLDEQAEIPDSLSQAIARSVTSDPTGLLTTGPLDVTLTRASSRRFANVLRLSLSLRLVNRGRAPVFSGDVVIRAIAGGEALAPLEPLGEVVEAGTSASPTVLFDLPTSAEGVDVEVSIGNRSASRTLDLR